MNFIKKNIVYPELSKELGIQGNVYLEFIIDKQGNVSDIKPLTNHGYGVEEEAMRVLKKASKWEPAIQNGIKVKAYRKQVIVFEVTEE